VATTDWNPHLRDQFAEPYWQDLHAFVADERARGPVHPPPDSVFAALHLTPLGSVRPGVTLPPSLRNVFAERESDLGLPTPPHGCLERWARDGVLLLNTTLTVREGQAASHQGHGWETFTDQVIRVVAAAPQHVVFILWGAAARKKAGLVDRRRHTIIQSAHPSPLSAHNGFFGSRPFSRANDALIAAGQDPLTWKVDGED
jgi:uracil-DNA glycosylase